MTKRLRKNDEMDEMVQKEVRSNHISFRIMSQAKRTGHTDSRRRMRRWEADIEGRSQLEQMPVRERMAELEQKHAKKVEQGKGAEPWRKPGT
jgi:hypothetical protein